MARIEVNGQAFVVPDGSLPQSEPVGEPDELEDAGSPEEDAAQPESETPEEG